MRGNVSVRSCKTMIFPCPDSVRCPGSDFPVTNFSSEDPDPPIRIGYSTGTAPTPSFFHYGGSGPTSGPPSGPGPADPPGPLVTPDTSGTGTGGDPPQLDAPFDNATVTTFVEVTDPGLNPDDVAGNDNVNQLVNTDGTPGNGGRRRPTGQPQQVYVNHPTTCTIFCSDGSPFSFTVPVGRFRSLNQAQADSAAYSYACKQAYNNRICLGSISSKACVGTVYDQTIIADTANVPITFTLVSGVIPSWITATASPDRLRLHGTPGSGDVGTSVFTIEASEDLGFTMTKNFSITVSQCGGTCMVTETNLPAFDQGQPYSYQIHATGGTAPYSWSLVEGVLPTGLSLSPTGLISGTVALQNGNLDQIFTVEVADSSSPVATCEGTILLPVLDYHNYPPGKKWRIQGYVDGTLNAACCQVCVLCNVWDGKFSTQIGSANFGDNGTNGITNHVTTIRLLLRQVGPPEWAIFLPCGTIPGNAVWVGSKVWSNAGSKLDSPAGVYTFNNYFGFTNVCDSTVNLTIEEY